MPQAPCSKWTSSSGAICAMASGSGGSRRALTGSVIYPVVLPGFITSNDPAGSRQSNRTPPLLWIPME